MNRICILIPQTLGIFLMMALASCEIRNRVEFVHLPTQTISVDIGDTLYKDEYLPFTFDRMVFEPHSRLYNAGDAEAANLCVTILSADPDSEIIIKSWKVEGVDGEAIEAHPDLTVSLSRMRSDDIYHQTPILYEAAHEQGLESRVKGDVITLTLEIATPEAPESVHPMAFKLHKKTEQQILTL